MTLVTIHAVVHIPAHVRVLEIIRIPAAMATGALEYRVIARIRVAGRADAVGVAVVGWEIGVIERRTGPGRGRVAGVACRREARGCVIGIRCPVVVSLMAAVTRRRQRCVVIVHVTLSACYGQVCSGQRKCRLRMIE